jgi:FAD/FMN-containing dehydrogenase
LAVVELALPVARAPAFVGQVRELADHRGASVTLFGGVGVGCLEVAIAGADPGHRQSFCRDVLAMALTAGGSLAGGTGTGLTWSDWLDLALPAPAAATLRQVKAALDPKGTLRPAGL